MMPLMIADRRFPTPAEEPTLLEPWQRAFDDVLGDAPRLVPFDGETFGIEGLSQLVVSERTISPPEMAGGSGHFRHMPAMAEQVRRLGYRWEGTGRLWTMPSPASFNALLRHLAPEDAGFTLACVEEDREVLSLGPWLLRAMSAQWTIHLCSTAHYRKMLVGPHRAAVEFQLMSMAHDVGVHALNYHLVPRRFVRELADRIRQALPERHATWSDPAALVPLHLTYFWDNDFNRYCYAVWCRTATPEAFDGLFSKNFAQLAAALEVRLAEVRRGLGEVASGETKDMPPPQPVDFRID